MATVVDIPNVGVVEFPDGMSQDDVARESETLYSRFARNQPPPQYEGMLAGPPGFEQPARSPEELAARNTRARQELGIPEGETPRTFGQIVTEPLVKLARVTPQMVQDAWSFISAWGAAGEGWISPETAQEIAGAQSEKPGTAAKVTAGLVNAAESVPETFTSPLGIATLGAGTLGATGARLVSAGFAVDMLANTPHAVQAWRDSLKTGDAALISEASAGLALHGLMTFAAGRHAVTSPKTIKAKQLADAIRVSEAEAGRLMETPEWQAAVERAAAAGAKPVERLAPQTAEAMREMGPFKGEFVETGPRAPEAKVEPPVVPPARETVVPNVQTELETKPTELQPASSELKPPSTTAEKPLWQLTPDEAVRSGANRGDYYRAVEDAFRNEKLTEEEWRARDANDPSQWPTVEVGDDVYVPQWHAAGKVQQIGYGWVDVVDSQGRVGKQDATVELLSEWNKRHPERRPIEPLKGAEYASRIPSDETKPATAGVQPEAGEGVRGADVERPAPVESEPVVARGEEAEGKAPETPSGKPFNGTITFETYDEPSGEWVKREAPFVVSRSTNEADPPWRMTVIGGPKDSPVAIGHSKFKKASDFTSPAAVDQLAEQLGRYVRNISIQTESGMAETGTGARRKVHLRSERSETRTATKEAERPAPEAPAKVNKRQVHSEFSAALESIDDQAKLDILSEMGYDINPDNERLYMVDRDNRKLYLTGDQLVEAKQEFVRLAKERQAAPEAPKPEVTKAETAPVVAAKMQAEVSDVAKTEGQRPAKEVKKDLVAELEKALADAPFTREDYYAGLYVKVPRTLSEHFALTDRPVEGTRPLSSWLKEPQTQKIKEPNESSELGLKFIAEALTRKQVPKVTIEIPGDGKFTVWNTKDAIQGLLDRARKLSTSTEPPKGFKESKPSRVQGQQWMKEAAIESPKSSIVGMGGAVPEEFAQRAQTATSIKNATVDQERATRGLPPAMEPAKRSFGTVWDEAMALVDREPDRQDALIAELKKTPRALTDTEDALLLHRQIDLQNEFAKATRDLAQAYEDGRLADVEDQRVRVDYLSDKLLELYDVNKTAGTETGRGLAARKLMAYEDFSLAKMEMEKRAAKGGAPLTDKERTELQNLSKKIEDTQKAYDEQVAKLQQRVSELEAQRIIDEAKAAKPPEAPPEVKSLVERVVLTLEREADAARARLREKFARTSAGVDPTILSDVAIIGTAKLARGTLSFARWTEAMLKDLGEQVRPYFQDAWKMANEQLDSRIEAMAKAKEAAHAKRLIRKADAAERKKDATNRITAKVAANNLGEISPAVQKLARAIVEENPSITRAQLVDEVHSALKEIVPDITRRQAMDAISGYGQFKQLSKDEVSRTLRDLKGQLQQVAKIEDIESKKPPLKTGLERRAPSSEERRLIKLVNEAKRRFGIVVTDPATQLQSALGARKTYYRNQIEDLQAQIAAKEKFVKTRTLSPTDAELESLKAKRDTLKKEFDDLFGKPEITVAQRAAMLKTALENRIAEYQRRLDEGDFTPRKPKPFDVSQFPELVRLKAQNEALKEEFRKGVLLDRMRRRSAGQKAYDVAKEILNLPRNMLSSWDLSAVLRQGGFIVFGHPIRGAKSLGPMLRALASAEKAKEVETQILSRPNAPLYARSKLYLAPLEDLRLTAQEEQIMSRFAHRVPGLRASNRAFITFLNKLRADSFDAMTAALSKDRPLEQGELNAIANYINVATGRGNLGKAAAAAETLATVFFSPRLMASRFQLLAGQPLYRGSARTRTMVAKEYARTLIGLGVVYGLGRMAGAEIEEDPRSSDFGKLKFGNTRVDPLMGLSQNTVLLSRLISGETITARGAIHPVRGNVPFGKATGSDLIGRFLRSKLSPVVGAGVDLATGKNVVGEPVSPGSVAVRLTVPLAFSDILDVMEENGIERGAAIELLSILGMGVQNYGTQRSQ